MDHLQSEMAIAHVAENAHAMTRCQYFLLTGIEREKAQGELCVALRRIGDQAHELPARPILDVRLDDLAFDLQRKARR